MDTPSLPLQRVLEQQRIALLEERVVRLERALSHLLREPAIAKPAPPRQPGAAQQQRLLLDTQSIRPDAAALRAPPPASQTVAPPAKHAAAPPPAKHPATTQPIKVTPPKAASAGTVNLALTAAFQTLDCSVGAAADDQSASCHARAASAPMFELNPELLDTARLRGIGRTLTVKSALEEYHPSLLRQLTGAWGTAEALPALRRLLLQDRGGRLGIEAGAREEVALLCEILEDLELAAQPRA